MSDAAAAPPSPWTPVLTVLRHVAGWLAGSAVAGLVWIIVVQEGIEREWMEVDFVRSLGTLIDAPAAALTERAWYATMVLWAALALVILGVRTLVPIRRWWAGIVFAPAVYLLWGLLYMGLVDARAPEYAAGLFGVDDGWSPPVLYAVASAVCSVVLVRVYDLMAGREWWRSKEHSLEESLAALAVPAPSLELAEQRPEDGREGTRP